MKNLLKLVFAVFFCELVGLSATPFTISAIPTWYQTLHKPMFSPPNWIFAPVWTTLYFLMGVALYLIWQRGIKKDNVQDAIKLFLLQLFLNFTWSLIFFGLHLPILAFIDIVLLWTSILLCIKVFYSLNKTASFILIPYLLWVSFAGILNAYIVILNP